MNPGAATPLSTRLGVCGVRLRRCPLTPPPPDTEQGQTVHLKDTGRVRHSWAPGLVPMYPHAQRCAEVRPELKRDSCFPDAETEARRPVGSKRGLGPQERPHTPPSFLPYPLRVSRKPARCCACPPPPHPRRRGWRFFPRCWSAGLHLGVANWRPNWVWAADSPGFGGRVVSCAPAPPPFS